MRNPPKATQKIPVLCCLRTIPQHKKPHLLRGKIAVLLYCLRNERLNGCVHSHVRTILTLFPVYHRNYRDRLRFWYKKDSLISPTSLNLNPIIQSLTRRVSKLTGNLDFNYRDQLYLNQDWYKTSFKHFNCSFTAPSAGPAFSV